MYVCISSLHYKIKLPEQKKIRVSDFSISPAYLQKAYKALKSMAEATTTTTNMELDTGDEKRLRGEEEVNGGKKHKGEISVEEERLEQSEEVQEDVKMSEPVSLGPKNFTSSVEMFDYFYKFLHYWPANLDVNKYEFLMLHDLLKKGHAESEKKIGGGVRAFQVRYHPEFKSRCFFLVRTDDSSDDFSFRKCVDHIMPLPENMKVNTDANKALGGRGGGGRGHGGRGGGRGGRGGRRGGRGRGRNY